MTIPLASIRTSFIGGGTGRRTGQLGNEGSAVWTKSRIVDIRLLVTPSDISGHGGVDLDEDSDGPSEWATQSRKILVFSFARQNHRNRSSRVTQAYQSMGVSVHWLVGLFYEGSGLGLVARLSGAGGQARRLA